MSTTESPSALEIQVGGTHYKDFAIQPVEFIETNDLPYTIANVIKYVLRDKDNRAQDLGKASHYLLLYKELRMDSHRHWRKILWSVSPNGFITTNALTGLQALVIMRVCSIATSDKPESCWEDAMNAIQEMIRTLPEEVEEPCMHPNRRCSSHYGPLWCPDCGKEL